MKINKVSFVVMTILLCFALYLRLSGIIQNHSFWADEAYISSIGRDVVTGEKSLWAGINSPGGLYQPLQVVVTTVSFSVVGVSEFGARLPSVIFGSLAIILVFLITRYFSNTSGGLLGAFLTTISQLNIAHATQAKPYIAIQFFVLLLVYLLILLKEQKYEAKHLHAAIIGTLLIIMFFHVIGIFAFAIYLTYLLVNYWKKVLKLGSKAKLTILIGLICLLGFFIFYFQFVVYSMPQILQFNHITYLRELFWKNYAFILLPATFGTILAWKRDWKLTVSILSWIAILLFFWTFQHYSKNIRYIIPIFAFMFIYFGIFWAAVGEKLFEEKSWLICLIVAGMLFAGGHKTVRKPQAYYSPNQDLIGDVQFADHKRVFAKIEQEFPNYHRLYIVNDLSDAESWYLDRYSDAYFVKGIDEPVLHPIANKPMYGSLKQFKEIIQQKPHGLLIVEDWHSFLPDDVKLYAKENLMLEFRIEGIPEAGVDTWPIEVYSWGIKDE